MELDARTLRNATLLEADLCIVGAGPAGLVLAREWSGRGRDVLVLESGGHGAEAPLQELNEGGMTGDEYAGLRETRHRQVGGSANLWNTALGRRGPWGRWRPGAKYVPLDPVDLEARGGDLSGWPLTAADLRPFYERAQSLCGLGPFAYAGDAWADALHPALALADDRLTSAVYQLGFADVFTRALPAAVRRSPDVRLCHHATLGPLETSDGGRRVVGAEAACLGGTRLRIRARVFVLAAGAIENARLLLASAGPGGQALGNAHGWVGRCLMEHPRDTALTWIPHTRDLFRQAAFYDRHRARDGTLVAGRLAPGARLLRDEGLPNASATLLPLLAGGRDRGAGYGWSRWPARRLAGFRLLLNVEQRPHPENRVTLGSGRDALGQPRAEAHWRWRDEDRVGLARVRAHVAEALEAAGPGRVECRQGTRPDPNAHHHAGTTRMHADPRHGVVDADGRVHGTGNLYVAGASVFPRAGFANPTLTLVALALRLAEHLERA